MSALSTLQRIHVIGAGGAGMSALAKVLAQMGKEVSGSDLKPSGYLELLGDLGVETWTGHRPERAGEWDLVVASSAVPDRDPEVMAAAAAGVPVWERPRLLAAITQERPAAGFAGTHGKTTSTAMAVAAAKALGLDPTFVVGGELVAHNTNAHLGTDDLFILEADEAFGTFLELDLNALAITNIEADHLDHYATVGALEAAFATVAQRTNGPVVFNADDAAARRLGLEHGSAGYGISPEADWSIQDVEHETVSVRFSLTGRGETHKVRVPKPGMHNARNAAGVLALFGEMGHDVGRAAAGIAEFAGVRRRFELRGRPGGVTVVDDYAHHPTEVAATLGAARLGTEGRVLAVFQPHRYSRTAEHAAAFGPALAVADHVIVTDVYPAGERPQPGVTGKLVADAVIAAGGRSVRYVPARAEVAAAVAAGARPGDSVVLLGAGDVTGVADELIDLLGR